MLKKEKLEMGKYGLINILASVILLKMCFDPVRVRLGDNGCRPP